MAQARAKAAKLKSDANNGISPKQARLKERLAIKADGISFREVARECLNNLKQVKRWKNNEHARRWMGIVNLHAFPDLGDRPINSITSGDIFDTLKKIWETKTATALKLHNNLHVIFEYAKVKGYVSGENPARWNGLLDQFLPPASRVRTVQHRAAVDWHDVPEVIKTMSHRATNALAANAIIFGIVTASRAQEFCEAKWSEIDFENSVWSVPTERRKDFKPYPHRVPLPDQLIELLKDMPRWNDFVFPGIAGNSHIARGTPIKLLRNIFGAGTYTMHGFRSTFRDWGAEHSIDRILMEKALSHTTGNEVEQAYQRSDLLELRRPVMQQWANWCFSALSRAE